MEVLSAIVVGLVGSLHCAGMCGPIAIALPLSDRSWFARISGGILYNSGRAITYALLGAIFGLLGMGIALGGMQQWASILLGIIMILSVLVPRIGSVNTGISRIVDPVTSEKSLWQTVAEPDTLLPFPDRHTQWLPAMRPGVYCPGGCTGYE
jgi:sulfite exporter TauE/SafE